MLVRCDELDRRLPGFPPDTTTVRVNGSLLPRSFIQLSDHYAHDLTLTHLRMPTSITSRLALLAKRGMIGRLISYVIASSSLPLELTSIAPLNVIEETEGNITGTRM